MNSRRQFLATAGTLSVTLGITGCANDTDQPDTENPTDESPDETQIEGIEWETYRNDQFGFEIQYPADASLEDVPDDYSPQIPVIDESTPAVESRSALLIARRSEIQITVGHIDVSIDQLTESLAGETRQVGEEAQTRYSEFDPKQIAGQNGYEVELRRYAGTGAGTEGRSCSGKGAVVSASSGGTLFLFVERCVSDITSDPERTPELTAIFDEMVDSIRLSE